MIKRIVLSMAALFLVGGLSMAQGRPGGDPKEQAERMTERLVKELSLNDDQKAQLLEVTQAWTEKMQEMMPKGRPDMKPEEGDRPERPEFTDEMRAEMDAAREAYEESVKNILTDEQFEAFKKVMQDRRGGPGRGPGAGPGPHHER